MNISYKGIEANVKDIDQKEGIVTGYFSVFGNIDSDGDMIMPGAFAKTLQENGPTGKNRIMHLWQHNPSEPIGKPHVIKEDAYGLYFETKLAKTSRGIDALKLYEDGIINEHSIGFNVVKHETKSDHTALTELKLWEGSTVTWGANALTYVTGVKAMGGNPLDAILKQRETLYNAIRKGTYTDDTFQLLIGQLEYFDTQLKDLFTTQPEVKTTTEPELKESDILSLIAITKQTKF